MGYFATRIEAMTTAFVLYILPNPRRISWNLFNDDAAIECYYAESSSAPGSTITPKTPISCFAVDGEDPTAAVYLRSASGTPNIRIVESYA